MNPGTSAAVVAREFAFGGDVPDIISYGNGHIHDTYLVTCSAAFAPGAPAPNAVRRFILQRVNRNVFHEPIAVMQNIERVTAHLAALAANEADGERRALALIPTVFGHTWYGDSDGEIWRAFRFVERTHTVEIASSPAQAFEAARAFGRFQGKLATLPLPPLHETIPDFHNTPKRFEALQRVIEQDRLNRVVLAQPEIGFAMAREGVTGILIDADMPARIVHNDTKLNNVLFDETTGEGICVIDLDTVMPGLALNDFGDLVRTAAATAAEDERDLSQVTLHLPLFEALVRGYLEGTGDLLTHEECQLLPEAGMMMTLEQGIRFLTDYLNGDRYFKAHRDGQNLDRCRTQFRLVESMETQTREMRRILARASG